MHYTSIKNVIRDGRAKKYRDKSSNGQGASLTIFPATLVCTFLHYHPYLLQFNCFVTVNMMHGSGL